MTKQKAFFSFLLMITFLLATPGCDSGPDNVRPAYDHYRFDQKVIDKLPLYDSLAVAIFRKLSLFQSLNGNDSNQPFRYGPTSLDENVFKRLPEEAGSDIDAYFSKLGKDFVSGFDAFHDSTIKIYVRSIADRKLKVNTDEHLSYYPAGFQMKQRKFPSKDTVLNTHWQYWTRFSRRELF